MYAENAELMYEQESYYELPAPTSDIQLPPALNILLLSLWILICLIGFVIIFVSKNLFLGVVVIGVPTFFGMVMKPTFALCLLMLVLPTGAGVGIEQIFSLDRGIGIAVAITFTLNLLISRPRLRLGNKALWVIIIYTIWIFFVSLGAPYLRLELRQAFTQLQLLALVLIVYWILETNGEKAFRWALRSYVVGCFGMIALTFITGAAMRVIEEEERYAATLGVAIDPNMMSALLGMAFWAAVYLLARDKQIFLRIIYLVSIVLMPIMILKTASRGGLVAFTFALMSPFLFVRQVVRKPALAVLLLVVIIIVSGSTVFLVKKHALEEEAAARITNIGYARQAFDYRLSIIKKAIHSSFEKPTGTGRYAWLAVNRSYPHSDFFYVLGIYGIPGATLFAVFMVMMMLTAKRIPLGVEKLYARTILIFLLVNGMSMGQILAKYFWVFMVLIITAEDISSLRNAEAGHLLARADEETPTIDY
ncbi:MAG: O-antigen ligase family protein [Planctomycetota bacterium]|jgi:hypothetical protein